MIPIFLLVGSGSCLLAGYMVGSQAGGVLANSMAEYLSTAQLTAIVLGLIAAVAFSVGTSGIANSALTLVIFGSLMGGGWIGFAFSDAELEPVVGQQASGIWHGVGITDAVGFLPGWAHDRVATFIVAGALTGVGGYGAGRLVLYAFILMIRRSLSGMFMVDDTHGVRTYVNPDPDKNEVVYVSGLNDKDDDSDTR